MEKMIINGGRRLCGRVKPCGSKNAALPLIFATLATNGISVLHNVPDITDVRVAVDLLHGYGVRVEYRDETLTLDTRNAVYSVPSISLTSSIRASSYLLGASLVRFGEFRLSKIGGCNFCQRPIDMHVSAAEALGAIKKGDALTCGHLSGNDIYFEKRSVGATINALIMASGAKGVTRIHGGASEPHVGQLTEFLRSAGADITTHGDVTEIVGGDLHGGEATVIPDMIEAGTFLLVGAATGGKVTVEGAAALGLDSFFDVLTRGGITVVEDGDDVTLCGLPVDPFAVVTSPYPGYPTDLQPQAAPIMALGNGGTIRETVWQSRFSYLAPLAGFGVLSSCLGSIARIEPSKLHAAKTYVPDLRGGAAAVICALAAEGESILENSEIISRGYAGFAERLRALGADIKTEKEN